MDRRNERKELIKSIGGTRVVAKMFGLKPNAITYWRRCGFPADTYLVLSEELAKIGKEADPSLWKFEARRDAAE
jgi:hypothetical protein